MQYIIPVKNYAELLRKAADSLKTEKDYDDLLEMAGNLERMGVTKLILGQEDLMDILEILKKGME